MATKTAGDMAKVDELKKQKTTLQAEHDKLTTLRSDTEKKVRVLKKQIDNVNAALIEALS